MVKTKIGTCYQAAMRAAYQDIVDVFGQPAKGDGYKTEAEWVIRFQDDRIATIYNYKTSRSWDEHCPDVKEVTVWHIGGHKSEVVDRVLRMLGDRATLTDRAR